MAKIDKIIINYNHFNACIIGVYITTFKNARKRSLRSDSKGFFFIQDNKIQRINETAEIQRINEFLNIK